MRESTLTSNIKRNLSTHFGGWWVKIHGGPYQITGIPDIIGLCKGKFFGIEVKLPGKEDTLTDRQKHIITIINDNGGFAIMSTSVEHSVKFVGETLKLWGKRGK